MEKKEKVICILERKACKIGIVMSLIFSVLVSFGSAAVMINAGLGDEKISILNLGVFLYSILFVVFGIFVLGFIVICSRQNDKSKN